jgi:hypothetical protein
MTSVVQSLKDNATYLAAVHTGTADLIDLIENYQERQYAFWRFFTE